jgi:SpoVK/Ycf46/Vps4 family AAA+-type ATPase
MSQVNIFDSQTALPDPLLTTKQKTLLGFENRFSKVRDRLRLLLNLSELETWSNKNHGIKLALCDLVSEQYPLVIFHGDVGTGKTATAECIANQLVIESKTEDSILFKLSNRVRGSGKVGEMGTLLTQAFHEITQSIGKNRRAILVIDEGDSLAAARSQEHSHHEDKVAVNTLIQCIDDLRRFNGRIVVFLCTNRISILDPAIQRRAGIVEEFQRPGNEERHTQISELGYTQQL